mgnify:FL=1
MKFKKVLYSLLVVPLLPLVGCTNKESDSIYVKFHTMDSKDSVINVDLKKGQRVSDILESNNELKNNLDKVTSKDGDETFDFWYLSKDSALNLDVGEDNRNIFTYEIPLYSSIDVYAGFYVSSYKEDIENHISYYLGSYQYNDISPIPYIKTLNEPTIEYGDNSSVANSFTYNGIVKTKYDYYVDSLINEYGFNKISETSYIDKLNVYTLNLDYKEENKTLNLSYSFNDKEDEFPTNFFSSSFFALDIRSLINDNSFILSENSKDEKFIHKSYIDGDIREKKIYYIPKSDDENPTYSFLSYLSNYKDVFTLYEDSNNKPLYIEDSTMSVKITANIVDNLSLEEEKIGIKKGMVEVTIEDSATYTLDMDSFNDIYSRVYPSAFNPDVFGEIPGINVYGTILRGTLSNIKVAGYYASGLNEDILEAYLKTLNNKGYRGVLVEDDDGTLQFIYNSRNNEYGMVLNYYSKNNITGLFKDYISVFYYEQDSVNEELSNWFKKSNEGGGDIYNIPEIETDGYYTSGYYTSNDSSLGYTHYYRASNLDEDYVSKYEEKLEKTNKWTKNEEYTNSLGYPVYVSNDGYYVLGIIYSKENKTLTIELNYNGFKIVSDTKDIYPFIKDRLSASNAFRIPDLSNLVDGKNKEVSVSQYYTGNDHRVFISIPYSDETSLNKAYEEYLNALNSDVVNWSYAGENSSGSIKFYNYKDGAIFAYSYISTLSDGSYSLTLAFYRK